ncbi:hypothetical protein BDZ91DRAFT_621471, partial [Kalaharituber pfeilii]
SAEARLYTFPPDVLTALKKFRLTTSRSETPQAVIYEIDRTTYELRPSPPADDDGPTATTDSSEPQQHVYTDLASLADVLPPHTPRFVLLSHPITLQSGRKTAPYVLLYWMPPTASAEMRMLYAGAKELMRNTAGVQK